MNRNIRAGLRPLASATMLALAASLGTACISTEDAISTCESDDDCGRGESCVLGICAEPTGGRGGRGGTDTGGLDVVVSDDTGEGTGADSGGSEADTGGTGTDSGGTGTDTGGTGTDSGGTGTDTGGTGSPCTAAFTACELTGTEPIEPSGAGFYCANTADGGICLPSCRLPFAVAGCPDDSVCVDLGEESAPLLACIPADCGDFSSPTPPCDAGDSCIEFADEVGLCFGAGTAAVGAACDVSSDAPADNCGPDAFCDTPSTTVSRGTCAALCDFWASESCGAGQTCGLLTFGTGFCQPLTAAVGPLEACTTPGDACGDRARCLTFDTPDGEQNLCATYCRRGVSRDCAALPGTVCNWNAFTGSVDYGICLPPCETNADCVAGNTCTGDGVCAQACTSDASCDRGDFCLDGVCKPEPT